jgi:hypothetical protein
MGLCVGKTAKPHLVSAWLCGIPLTAEKIGFHEAKIVSQKSTKGEGDFKGYGFCCCRDIWLFEDCV